MAANYFFYFAVLGTFMPYLSPLLLSLGFSKQESGQIWAVIHVFGVLNPLLGGRLSDRFLSADKLLRLCGLGMTAFALFMWWQSSLASWIFLLALFAFAASRSPVIPLQDTLAMQVARNEAQAYTRVRIGGSLGFAVAVTLFGYLAEPLGLVVFFPLLLLFASMFLASGFFLPAERKKAPAPGIQPNFWQSLGSAWWFWLLAMMGHWFCFGPYNYGFSLLLQEQGVSTQTTGWFWSIGVLAEILVFLYSGWFFHRWTYRQLLFFAMLANLGRWLLIGLYPQPWLIGATQILHGAGFGLFYAAALQGIHQRCGGVERASYQGLFATCVGGLASMLGTAVAGTLHQQMPLRLVLLWILPVQLLSVVLLYFFPLQKAASGSTPHTAKSNSCTVPTEPSS